MQKRVFFRKLAAGAPLLLLLAAVMAFAAQAFMHGVNMDEREHLYAAFLVNRGAVPYRDFFEHHHPLLWYLTKPLLYFCGNTPNVWYVLRALGMAVAMATARYIYKIGRITGMQAESAIISSACWIGCEIVRWAGSEYRPDNLMMLFFTTGLFYFFYYVQKRRFIYIQLAMALSFLSCAALQKAIILLMPLGVLILYLAWRGEVRRRDLLLALIIPALLFGAALLAFWQAGALTDYFELNWLINGKMEIKSPYLMPERRFFLMPALSLAAAAWLLFKKNENTGARRIIFLYLAAAALVLGVFPLAGLMPLWSQYFLMLCPFVALVAGYVARPLLQYRAAAAILMLAGAAWLCGDAYRLTAAYHTDEAGMKIHRRLDQIILELSAENDMVLCNIEAGTIGGLRLCVSGYYFFSFGSLVPIHRRYFHGRELPRLNPMLKVRRPKIVADTGWPDCRYDDEKHGVACDGSQELDQEWMQQNYTYHGFIWLRKD